MIETDTPPLSDQVEMVMANFDFAKVSRLTGKTVRELQHEAYILLLESLEALKDRRVVGYGGLPESIFEVKKELDIALKPQLRLNYTPVSANYIS